jgi:peptidoglycan/LPS O-acetylase OafA/YrhL
VLVVLMFLLLDDAFSGMFHMLYLWPFLPMLVAFCLFMLPFTVLLQRFFEIALLRYLASISFGIYVWHMVIVDLISKFLVKDFIYDGGMTLLSWFWASSLAIGLTVVIAHFSWHLVEKPLLKKISDRLTKKQVSKKFKQIDAV